MYRVQSVVVAAAAVAATALYLVKSSEIEDTRYRILEIVSHLSW